MFEGIIPPLTTPFSKDGRVLYSALEENLCHYLKTQLAGFLVLGSTGEAIHLKASERIEVARLVRSCVPENRDFLIGVSSPTLDQAREFIDSVGDLSVTAFLVSVPSYYKNRMNQRALRLFFEGIARHAPAPLLLYNIPQYSGIQLEPELVADLASHEGIVGMKDSSGNLIYLQSILREVENKSFQVVLGSAQLLGAASQLGIRGGILAIACALPKMPIQVLAGIAAASERKCSLAHLFIASQTLVARFGIPGLKYAMDLAGLQGGFCRQPLLPLEEAEEAEIRKKIVPLLEVDEETRPVTSGSSCCP